MTIQFTGNTRARVRAGGGNTDRGRSGIARAVVTVVGELLITCGVLLILFVGWELWWTNIAADQSQARATHAFVDNYRGPLTPQPGAKASIHFGPPEGSVAPRSDGTVFGVIYIPRLGPDYSRPLVQGTSTPILDTLGLGHYDTSTMPGALGNFAVAGHRQTHGAVLDHIDTLVPGDKIYVQTSSGYYTYVFRNEEIVLPTQTNVLQSIPAQPGSAPTERLMTMTSCNPRFGSQERIIAYSVLQSWQPATVGPPAAIAQQIATIKRNG